MLRGIRMLVLMVLSASSFVACGSAATSPGTADAADAPDGGDAGDPEAICGGTYVHEGDPCAKLVCPSDADCSAGVAVPRLVCNGGVVIGDPGTNVCSATRDDRG